MLVVGDTPIQEVKKMKKSPHLLGQKEVNDLSDQDNQRRTAQNRISV